MFSSRHSALAPVVCLACSPSPTFVVPYPPVDGFSSMVLALEYSDARVELRAIDLERGSDKIEIVGPAGTERFRLEAIAMLEPLDGVDLPEGRLEATNGGLRRVADLPYASVFSTDVSDNEVGGWSEVAEPTAAVAQTKIPLPGGPCGLWRAAEPIPLGVEDNATISFLAKLDEVSVIAGYYLPDESEPGALRQWIGRVQIDKTVTQLDDSSLNGAIMRSATETAEPGRVLLASNTGSVYDVRVVGDRLDATRVVTSTVGELVWIDGNENPDDLELYGVSRSRGFVRLSPPPVAVLAELPIQSGTDTGVAYAGPGRAAAVTRSSLDVVELDNGEVRLKRLEEGPPPGEGPWTLAHLEGYGLVAAGQSVIWRRAETRWEIFRSDPALGKIQNLANYRNGFVFLTTLGLGRHVEVEGFDGVCEVISPSNELHDLAVFDDVRIIAGGRKLEGPGRRAELYLFEQLF